MPEYEQAVFISYAWGQESDERENIVNQLDQSLQQRGLKIIRDKRDLGYRGSIRNFMERIGEGDCVIVVISDKYLRSKNCMFELVEIAANKYFADRIFPIVLEDAKIYDWRGNAEYLEYWENEKTELSERIRGMRDLSNLDGLTAELNDYDRFRDEISRLTTVIKDMNCLTPEMLREANFQQIYDALMERIDKTSPMRSGSTTPRSGKEKKIMDPIALATAATSLLAPFIKKAGTAALDKLAEHLPETLGKVWNAITKKSESVTEAATDLANEPDNSENEVFFRKQLQKALEKDQEFAALLSDLVQNARSDTSISVGGDGVAANNNSTAVGSVSIGGSVNGNFVIGNNNQVNNK